MNPPLTKPAREPFPRGFWAYVSLLGGLGVSGVGGPFYVKEAVLNAVNVRVVILETQFQQMNHTLTEIKDTLGPAIDFQAEAARIDGRIKTLVKDSSLKQ